MENGKLVSLRLRVNNDLTNAIDAVEVNGKERYTPLKVDRLKNKNLVPRGESFYAKKE